MSCNGCRVLRKGCSDSCVLRQCLRSIEGGDAQGYATAFVAKFFGRAAMMGFINAVPENQRPALFQSLLYEACGRTVNPVHGSVGLLCSGNWHACQAAVVTILSGGSISGADATISLAASTSTWPSPLTQYYTTLSPDFDFYASSSWPAAGPAKAAASHAHSPNTDTLFHPLPLKRRRRCDPDSDANQKLLDGQSLSAGSTDHQEWRIQPSSDDLRSYKQLNEHLIFQQHTDHTNTHSLELTLSTPPCLPSQTLIRFPSATSWRSSNPPCLSLESEGSVTSLDSTHLSNTTASNSHKGVLDLLL